MMTHVYERFEAVEKKVNALASDVAKLDARLREVEATAFPPKHPTRVQEVSRCGKCDAEFLGECLTVEEEAEAKATKPASPPDKWLGVRVFYNERVDSYFVPILKKKWHGGTWFYSVSTVEDCIRFKNRELHDPKRTAWLDAHPLPEATEQQLQAAVHTKKSTNRQSNTSESTCAKCGHSISLHVDYVAHDPITHVCYGDDPKKSCNCDGFVAVQVPDNDGVTQKPVADASQPLSKVASAEGTAGGAATDESDFVWHLKWPKWKRVVLGLTAWLLPDRAEKAEAELAKYREWMDAEGHPTNLMVESGDYPQAWDIWYEALDTVGVDVCGQSVGDRLDGSEEIPAPEKAIRTILHMLSDAMYEAGLKDHELTSNGLATIAKELVEARAELAKVKAQRDARPKDITDPHPITVAELPDGAGFEVLLSGHWIERRVCNGNVEDADGNLSTPQTSDAYRGKEIRNVSLPVKGGAK